MMELHVWGDSSELARIDAECVASVLLVQQLKSKVLILTSSNENLSPSGKLPHLIDGEHTVSGYVSIASHLKRADQRSSREKLIDLAMMSYIEDNIEPLTLYTLFMNKENYENYSRGVFRNYLRFPLQYQPPLRFKADAVARCEQSGLALDNGLLVDEVPFDLQECQKIEANIRYTPTLSGLHKRQQEERLDAIMIQKNTLSNMKCMNLAAASYSTINKLITFGETLTCSEILLLAHVIVQTNGRLPNKFMQEFVEFNYPVIFEKAKLLEDQMDHVPFSCSKTAGVLDPIRYAVTHFKFF